MGLSLAMLGAAIAAYGVFVATRSATSAERDTAGSVPEPNPNSAPSVAAVAAGESSPANASDPNATGSTTVHSSTGTVPISTRLDAGHAAPTPAAARRSSHEFGASSSFRDSLVRAGIATADITTIVAALEGVMDFRRCQPDDTFVIERTAGGTLSTFEYTPGPTHSFRVTREGPSGYRAARVDVPIQRVRVAKAGYLIGSLAESLERAGLRKNLSGPFLEALGGRANVARGSARTTPPSFRIIVEEEHVRGEFLRYGNVVAAEYRAGNAPLRTFWFSPDAAGRGDYHDSTGRSVTGSWLRTPLYYDHISSGFDMRRRHPVLRRVVPHTGIDYAADPGTPVWAAAQGTVTFVGDRGPNGNLVALRHSDGYETYYAHLSRFAPGLQVGAEVRQRTVIGFVGSTGRSTGPHLHFGLKQNGRFVDPARVINGPGSPLPSAHMPAFRRVQAELSRELDRVPLGSAPASPRAVDPPPHAHDDDDGSDLPSAPARAEPHRGVPSPANRAPRSGSPAPRGAASETGASRGSRNLKKTR